FVVVVHFRHRPTPVPLIVKHLDATDRALGGIDLRGIDIGHRRTSNIHMYITYVHTSMVNWPPPAARRDRQAAAAGAAHPPPAKGPVPRPSAPPSRAA